MNRRFCMAAAVAGFCLILGACRSTEDNSVMKAAPPQYKVRMQTPKGDIVILVHRDWAPHGADHFYELVNRKFYDGNRFFRVVPNFVVQWGMNGNPDVNKLWENIQIPDDPPKVSNKIGTVVFAATGEPNSRTTQLFINMADNSRLDPQGFSPFAEVIQGMENVMNINTEYGEQPQQGAIEQIGNDYLEEHFPRLDYVKTARVVP